MKNLLSSTLVASMCALAGASAAQTSTTPAATGTQTREQADRKGAPPPATTGTGATAGTSGGMSATPSGPPKANTATRTEEQAARNDGDPTSIYDRKGMGAMLKRMDANRDGMVSREEYMQFHEGVYQRMPKDGNGMVSVGTGMRRQ
jgi:hypothetical protein